YLMIATGGALGGITVSLIAPLIFTDYWELEFGLALCWLLLAAMVFLYPTPLKRYQFLYSLLVSIATVSVSIFVIYFASTIADDRMNKRNFYGVIHVKEKYPHDPKRHMYILNHGITLHGFEFVAPTKRNQPTTYFFPKSGVGIAITHHPHYG